MLYKGHELVAQPEGTGWVVIIGDTGMRTMNFQDRDAAFEDAKKYVDSLPSKRR